VVVVAVEVLVDDIEVLVLVTGVVLVCDVAMVVVGVEV